jgi:Fe-S-cluster containining protein
VTAAERGPADPLAAAAAELVRSVDGAMAKAVRLAGPLLGCGPGRTDCCRGPFPVNLLDARRLQRGLAALGERDPAQAEAVRRRARDTASRLSASFPGDPATGLLGGDEAAEERFSSEHSREPCPALDPETARCDLYEWRPLVCRTMGPPVRIGGIDLPPCPFCFAAAPPADLERCRVTPDPEGREDALVGELERRLHRRGETIVAFALAGRPAPSSRARSRAASSCARGPSGSR